MFYPPPTSTPAQRSIAALTPLNRPTSGSSAFNQLYITNLFLLVIVLSESFLL